MSRVSGRMSGLDPERAAEVITDRAVGADGRGSGYLVTSRQVLTAAHVLTGAVEVRVRFNADQAGEWSARAEATWSDPNLDIAVLSIRESSIVPRGAAPVAAGVRFGRIVRPPVDCETLGFPLFKLREDPSRLSADDRPSRYRNSEHAIGTVTSWSGLRDGTMSVRVGAPERDPKPDRSPWEGMSGAALFSGEYLIGVIGKHHRGDGPGTLTAYRVDHWLNQLTAEQIAELASLIGLPDTPGALAQLTAAGQPQAGRLPRLLPATTSAFTGREDELAQLLTLGDMAGAGATPGMVVISAIDGMAGIGKTALAVHAGHLLADRFPDGQLFIDLHGYTRGLTPRDPADVLAIFLQAFDVPPQKIPADPEARAALFRERLAGTRTLLVLDNAATEGQIRPLIPAESQCLVLVTSRRRLKALDDAHTLALDVLPMPDAVALFRTVASRASAEAAVDGRVGGLLEEVVDLCGRLPLALRIAAALIRHRPAWNLALLADRLRQARLNLQGFTDGDRDLATVFDLSYQVLTASEQELFRSLGLVPGPEVDAYSAAALLDTDPASAERLLQDLVDHSLLTELSPGRYRMHDLLRLHARTLVGRESADQRARATGRLLDYYRYTAGRAEARIARRDRSEPVGPAPAHVPPLPDADTARAWLRAERANLEAALDYAAGLSRDELVVALTAGLVDLLRTDGPWTQAQALHTAALAAAQRLRDKLGQADALTEMGILQRLTGRLAGAARDLEAALNLFRDLDDRNGQASALAELGSVRAATGDILGAIRDQEAALHLRRDLDDRRGLASVLGQLGTVRATSGDYAGAVRDLEAALDLSRDLGDRNGQASALRQLGTVRHVTGDHVGAAQDLEAALDLFRDLDDRRGQAHALNMLGDVRRTTGDLQSSARDQEAALELFRDLGDRNGQAGALTHLGTVRHVTGDHAGAARDLEAALELFREIGARGNEAWGMNHYAAAVMDAGDPERALSLYRDAGYLAREVHQPDDEALALEGIAECLLRMGDPHEAVVHLNQALAIFRRLGMHDSERIEARLAEFDAP
jgi:tetratricopeptide (TPR) repeat protein